MMQTATVYKVSCKTKTSQQVLCTAERVKTGLHLLFYHPCMDACKFVWTQHLHRLFSSLALFLPIYKELKP